MTHEEFKKLKTGDKVYVPLIEKFGEISVGTHYIGSDSFEKYCIKQLTVKESVIHDYDPEHKQFGWRENLVVQFVRFDISVLSEIEQENFYKLYRDYYPVLSKAWDDVKQYKGCFEVPYNRGDATEDNSYAGKAISLLQRKKKDADKTVRKLNLANLKRVDNIIKFYKEKVRPEVKRFINEK